MEGKLVYPVAMSIKYVLINGTILSGVAKIDNCALAIDDEGRIDDVFRMKRLAEKEYPSSVTLIDVKGAYITPGLIDTHLHGIGGYGTEDCSVDSILGMSERLADFGVTSFLPTVYTDRLDKMVAATKAIVLTRRLPSALRGGRRPHRMHDGGTGAQAHADSGA